MRLHFLSRLGLLLALTLSACVAPRYVEPPRPGPGPEPTPIVEGHVVTPEEFEAVLVGSPEAAMPRS